MIRFKVKVMLAVRDMTQKELAERTGIRPPTISAICLGTIKQLPIEGLNKICKALDCQPSDLMEYVEDSTEDTPETAEQPFQHIPIEKSVCGQSFKEPRRAAGKRHRGQVFQDSSGKIQFSAYTGAELPLRGAFISGNGCNGNTRK